MKFPVTKLKRRYATGGYYVVKSIEDLLLHVHLAEKSRMERSWADENVHNKSFCRSCHDNRTAVKTYRSRRKVGLVPNTLYIFGGLIWEMLSSIIQKWELNFYRVNGDSYVEWSCFYDQELGFILQYSMVINFEVQSLFFFLSLPIQFLLKMDN